MFNSYEGMLYNIAGLCHQVNKAYCESQGDFSQPDWNLLSGDFVPNKETGVEEYVEDWRITSAMNGVKFHLNNPDATPEKSHQNWLKEKEEAGWKYGPVKDVEKKEHPCFVPYDELPPEQKAKDFIFKAIVDYYR